MIVKTSPINRLKLKSAAITSTNKEARAWAAAGGGVQPLLVQLPHWAGGRAAVQDTTPRLQRYRHRFQHGYGYPKIFNFFRRGKLLDTIKTSIEGKSKRFS